MGWKQFFWVAAIFNLIAGLPLLLAPDAMVASLGLPAPADFMFHRMTALLVVCFGGLYAFVAQDLERYRPLLWLGVAGKAGVVAMFTEAYLSGRLPFSAYAVSLGDVAFLAGFLIFLLGAGRRA